MRRKLYIEAPAPLSPRWRAMGVAIVLVCIIFTFILWFFLESSNKQAAQARLASDATSALDLLETRVEVYGDVLYGTRALLLAQPNLTREQWDAYTQSQGLFDRYPGLNNVLYAAVGTNDEADEILADINNELREGEPTVAILPETPTDGLAVIEFSTNQTSRRGIGRNIFAYDYLMPTLQKADILGVPTASPPFPSLSTERVGTNDFIIALAVYDGTYRPELSDEDKRAAVTGYVITSLHPETLFNAAVESMQTTDEVYVEATNTSGSVVYQTGNKLDEEYIEHKATIGIGDEDWNIAFRAPASYQLSPREMIAPTFFLIGGCLFMIMLITLYFYRQGIRMKWREEPPRKRAKEGEE